MTILWLCGLTVIFQILAFGKAFPCNWIGQRRWKWFGISVALLLLAIQSIVSYNTVHAQISTHLPSESVFPSLFPCLIAAFLFFGILQLTHVFRLNQQAEDVLRKEKRHLSMIVDLRVADLEAEVAERARAEEALRREGERLSAIILTQHDIATADLELDAVMNLIVERTQKLTQASGAILEILEEDALVYRSAAGRASPYVGMRVSVNAGLSGRCVQTGEILRCDDAERDPRVDLTICRRVGARSIITVPLHYKRSVIGVLQVLSPEPHAFSALDVHTLQLMAGLMGAAMSHSAEFETKQALLVDALQRADLDPLTALLNHRAFHKRFDDEVDRALRDGSSLTIAVLDLDNFKFFNDAYGHTVGDEVLRQVASALRNCCRSYDVLARFGGDEFALLMPNTTTSQAAHMAERLDQCLNSIGYRPPGADADIPFSLSFGLATFPDEGGTRLDVLQLADARLYRAKSGASTEDQAEQLRLQLSGSIEGFSMLDALVTAVDNKDRYTHRHSEDVMAYSLEIAKEIGLDAERQHIVAVAALLHDVGKIGVPDHILRKPGMLTDAEFKAVQQHPLMGAVIVGAVTGFEDTLEAIRHHHERWDGRGYPFGLRGEETPLMARLMAVADAYSAMTTDRPYRKGMPAEKALAILEDGAGHQWDPVCVRAFLRARRRHMPLAELAAV